MQYDYQERSENEFRLDELDRIIIIEIILK